MTLIDRPRWVDILIVIVFALLCIGAGWTAQGWRKDRDIADINKTHADNARLAAEQNAKDLAAAKTRGDQLGLELEGYRNTLFIFAQEKTREIDRLATGRRCLDGDLVGVLNRTHAAQRGGVASQATGLSVRANGPAAAGADDGQYATDRDVSGWINLARTQYDTCRAKLDTIRLFYEGKGQLSDIIDRAQEREEEMRQDALADRARQAQTPAGDSATVCAMCGDAIPEARRIYVPGVQTCVECQTDLERLGMPARRG
ncbi:MAG TPA: TraR/DksA family transcriptional regulator [Rhodocyclaceae bacterium]|nr:TraR/DksA family transcriptional regulator [Rhodocyclaceae bacterium]